MTPPGCTTGRAPATRPPTGEIRPGAEAPPFDVGPDGCAELGAWPEPEFPEFEDEAPEFPEFDDGLDDDEDELELGPSDRGPADDPVGVVPRF